MIKNKHELSAEQKNTLESSILDFLSWLRKIKKLKAEAALSYNTISFPDPTAEDWIMHVQGTTVLFNTFITDKCTLEYYNNIVLHECFHLFVQDLPNKADAKRLKDDFGEDFMNLLDIEADYYTAMYLREVKHFPLIEIFRLNCEGSKIFGDPRIRHPKLERFIGSALSITNAYFKSPGWRPTKENDLYLPNISNITTDESIHVLISGRYHFMLSEIKADRQDFEKLKKCYMGVASAREYVETLLNFASKALHVPIPGKILTSLYTMHDNPMATKTRHSA